jgi:tetratricopeptide (TPR) repeat protein
MDTVARPHHRNSIMTLPRRTLALLLALLLLPALSFSAAPPPGKARGKAPARQPGKNLPMTGLAPAKLFPNLCVLRYPISTNSAECQKFFDQGLGFFYSYVWMEAARSFETAVRHDPNCPMAWWGLSRALERWYRPHAKALLKAHELRGRGSDREQRLIKASMQAKGQLPGVGDEEKRKQAAIATLDELLALYDDDEEAWYFRAQLSGGAGLFGGTASAVPFYKALLRINPLHPGANHELVHFYEGLRRPALGWVYAENYIKSSPGIPHAWHMQAHLATRLGRWGKTSDRSARAIELQRAYHKYQGVQPRQDWQFAHHLETLLVSLTHDGRFKEARAVKAEAARAGHKLWLPVFRLHLAERDYAEALKVVREQRRHDKALASYMAALVYLKQGDPERALPEIEVLRESARPQPKRRGRGRRDRQGEFRLWEAQGLYLCQTGATSAGMKLLQRAVERTRDDYTHHAWGNGAYYMEAWGTAALQAGQLDVAEEAFQEALAHDPGSVRGALGLQVLCQKQGRSEVAARYARLAQRCWARADGGRLEAERAALRSAASAKPDPSRARK